MVSITNTIKYQCYTSNKRQASGKRREEEEEKEEEEEEESNIGSQGCAAARGRQPKI